MVSNSKPSMGWDRHTLTSTLVRSDYNLLERDDVEGALSAYVRKLVKCISVNDFRRQEDDGVTS